MKTGTNKNRTQELENNVKNFITECNNELHHLQTDLLQLMESAFENPREQKHTLANQYSTVHKLFKLLECVKMYHRTE